MNHAFSFKQYGLLLGALLIASCGRETPPAAAVVQPVRVVSALGADASLRVLATGMVRAAVESPLAFKTGGILAEMRVNAGQAVSAGQTLALLATSDVDAALAQVRESLAKSERDLARAESLRAKGMISQQAEQDVRAQREVARASLAAAEFNRQQAVMVAPASGVILEKRAEAHETVAAGQPIVVLGRLDRGWVVRAGLSAADALKLAVGDPARVRLGAVDSSVDGKVTRIAATSDARTGTVEVEVLLAAHKLKLVSGMVAGLEFSKARAVAATPTLSLPLSAVLEGNAGRAKVFVLDGDGTKVKRLEISTGRLFDGAIEIVDGLPPQARIVSEGAAWLNDGDTVRVLH